MEKESVPIFPTNSKMIKNMQKSHRNLKLCLAVLLFYRYRGKKSLPQRPFNLKNTDKEEDMKPNPTEGRKHRLLTLYFINVVIRYMHCIIASNYLSSPLCVTVCTV